VEKTGVLVVHGSGFDETYGSGHFRAVILPPIKTLEIAFNHLENFMKKKGAPVEADLEAGQAAEPSEPIELDEISRQEAEAELQRDLGKVMEREYQQMASDLRWEVLDYLDSHPDEPLTEARPLVGDNALPYDRSKALGEKEIIAGLQKGLDAVVVNPVGILGPYDFKPSPTGEMLLKLCGGDMREAYTNAAKFVEMNLAFTSITNWMCPVSITTFTTSKPRHLGSA
jgi:hypothetical protein